MIRLLLISLFTLMSLLTVFRAPTYRLWMLAICVTEFPWIFIGIMGGLLLWGLRVQHWRIAGTVIGFLGLSLYLYPVIRAYTISSGMPVGLENIFGRSPYSSPPGREGFHFGRQSEPRAPFAWTRMITGLGANKIAYQTFTYKTVDHTPLTLDFYPAQTVKGPRPCVVVVHGGSWSSGNAQQLPELNSELARKGYQVATINYRLAPKYQNPAPVEDIASALAYLRAHAGALHIDTTRFVLLGRSAGGQIALLAAYTLPTGQTMSGQTAPGDGIRGVISFYGPADMVWGYSIPANPLIMDSRKVMEDYLGGPYPKVPDNYAASSPVLAVTPQSPPTLLIHGQNDVIVAYEHSIRLSDKLEQDGVPHYLLTLPWATHGCDFTLNGPSGQLSTYAVETFLEKIL
jgi:acetyl esterase/lipase